MSRALARPGLHRVVVTIEVSSGPKNRCSSSSYQFGRRGQSAPCGPVPTLRSRRATAGYTLAVRQPGRRPCLTNFEFDVGAGNDELEPQTLGLKARPELRRTPPQDSCRTRFSASRLPLALRASSAWQYKLAIHPKTFSDRPACAHRKRRVLRVELETVDTLDLTDTDIPSAKVEVRDALGQRYELTFSGWHRVQHPTPDNQTVAHVVEVRVKSGRTWFVFRSRKPGGRVLAIQSESVAVRQL